MDTLRELGVLLDLENKNAESSTEKDDFDLSVQTRRRVQYHVDNCFETVEDYHIWVDAGSLKGWEKKFSRHFKKTGRRIGFLQVSLDLFTAFHLK